MGRGQPASLDKSAGGAHGSRARSGLGRHYHPAEGKEGPCQGEGDSFPFSPRWR